MALKNKDKKPFKSINNEPIVTPKTTKIILNSALLKEAKSWLNTPATTFRSDFSNNSRQKCRNILPNKLPDNFDPNNFVVIISESNADSRLPPSFSNRSTYATDKNMSNKKTVQARQEIEKLKTEIETLINTNIKNQTLITSNISTVPIEIPTTNVVSTKDTVTTKLDQSPQKTIKSPSKTIKSPPKTIKSPPKTAKSPSKPAKSPSKSAKSPSPVRKTLPTLNSPERKIKEDQCKIKSRTYDPKTTREFMKKQKILRKEKLKEEQQKIQETLEARKQKLEELKQKSIKLVAESVKKSTKNSAKLSDVKINSKSNLNAQVDTNKPVINKNVLQSKRCRARSFDREPKCNPRSPVKPWLRSRSVSRELKFNERPPVNKQLPPKKGSQEIPSINAPTNKINAPTNKTEITDVQPLEIQTSNINKEKDEIIANTQDSNIENKDNINTTEVINIKPVEIVEKPDDKIVEKPDDKIVEKPDDKIVEKPDDKIEPPSVEMNKTISCDSEPSEAQKELSEIKQKLETSISQTKETPEWLLPATTLPYPYNFISAVRKKLEIATRVHQKYLPDQKNNETIQKTVEQQTENEQINTSIQCTIDKKILDIDSVKMPQLPPPDILESSKNSKTYISHNCRKQLYPPIDDIKEISVPPELKLKHKKILSDDSDSDTAKNIPELPHEELLPKPVKTENKFIEIPVKSSKTVDKFVDIPVKSSKPVDKFVEISIKSSKPVDKFMDIPVKSIKPVDKFVEIPVKSIKPVDKFVEIPVKSQKPTQTSNKNLSKSIESKFLKDVTFDPIKDSRSTSKISNISEISDRFKNITFDRFIPIEKKKSSLNIGNIILPEPNKTTDLTRPDYKIDLKRNHKKDRNKYPEDIDSILTHYSKMKSENSSLYSEDFSLISSKINEIPSEKTDTNTEYFKFSNGYNLKSDSISEKLDSKIHSNSSSKENIPEINANKNTSEPKKSSTILSDITSKNISLKNKTIPEESISSETVHQTKVSTLENISSLVSLNPPEVIPEDSIVTSTIKSIVDNNNKTDSTVKSTVDIKTDTSSKSLNLKLKQLEDKNTENIPQLIKPEIKLKKPDVTLNINKDRNLENIENNPNHIHLKLQAEVHLLNAFNNSLQQIISVEKNLPSNSGNKFSSINFKRGSDFDETKEIVPEHDETSICSQDLNLSNMNTNIDKSSLLSTTLNSIISKHDETIDYNKNPYVGLSLGMVEQMIKDEDIRFEHLKAILKLRDKALFDRTKGELAWLEIKKKELRENGQINDVTAIKKKQRGLIIKLEQERHEMHRLKQAHKQAAKARKTALREQKNIIKHQLSSTDQIPKKLRRLSHIERPNSGPVKVYRVDSRAEHFSETTLSRKGSEENITVTNSSVITQYSEKIAIVPSEIQLTESSALKSVETQKTSSHNEKIKRALLMKEADLEKRRKEAEELLQWHQRLKQEELEVTELERQAVKSIQTDDEEKIRVLTGAQLNKIWKGITGKSNKHFEEQKKYQMSKRSLDKFYQNARKIFKEVSEERRLSKQNSDANYSSEFEQTNTELELSNSFSQINENISTNLIKKISSIIPKSVESVQSYKSDEDTVKTESLRIPTDLSKSLEIEDDISVRSKSVTESVKSETLNSLIDKSQNSAPSVNSVISKLSIKTLNESAKYSLIESIKSVPDIIESNSFSAISENPESQNSVRKSLELIIASENSISPDRVDNSWEPQILSNLENYSETEIESKLTPPEIIQISDKDVINSEIKSVSEKLNLTEEKSDLKTKIESKILSESSPSEKISDLKTESKINSYISEKESAPHSEISPLSEKQSVLNTESKINSDILEKESVPHSEVSPSSEKHSDLKTESKINSNIQSDISEKESSVHSILSENQSNIKSDNLELEPIPHSKLSILSEKQSDLKTDTKINSDISEKDSAPHSEISPISEKQSDLKTESKLNSDISEKISAPHSEISPISEKQSDLKTESKINSDISEKESIPYSEASPISEKQSDLKTESKINSDISEKKSIPYSEASPISEKQSDSKTESKLNSDISEKESITYSEASPVSEKQSDLKTESKINSDISEKESVPHSEISPISEKLTNLISESKINSNIQSDVSDKEAFTHSNISILSEKQSADEIKISSIIESNISEKESIPQSETFIPSEKQSQFNSESKIISNTHSIIDSKILSEKKSSAHSEISTPSEIKSENDSKVSEKSISSEKPPESKINSNIQSYTNSKTLTEKEIDISEKQSDLKTETFVLSEKQSPKLSNIELTTPHSEISVLSEKHNDLKTESNTQSHIESKILSEKESVASENYYETDFEKSEQSLIESIESVNDLKESNVDSSVKSEDSELIPELNKLEKTATENNESLEQSIVSEKSLEQVSIKKSPKENSQTSEEKEILITSDKEVEETTKLSKSISSENLENNEIIFDESVNSSENNDNLNIILSPSDRRDSLPTDLKLNISLESPKIASDDEIISAKLQSDKSPSYKFTSDEDTPEESKTNISIPSEDDTEKSAETSAEFNKSKEDVSNKSISEKDIDLEISVISEVSENLEKSSESSQNDEIPAEDLNDSTKKGVSHIDVRKRVSEILADANGSRGDKSPRVQDLYTTTYDIAGSSDSTPDSGSPTNEFDKQDKTSFIVEAPYRSEAEELLRKQLEIEQEIKQLERQQQNIPYLFMREIPNKPPPPYKPPDFPVKPVVTSIIPLKSDNAKKLITEANTILFNAYESGKITEVSFKLNSDKDDQQKFMFDLCKEIAIEVCKPTFEQNVPSWRTQKNKFHNLFSKLPITKDSLNSILNKKVLQLLNFEPVIRNDSLIIRWSRKKRDHVDEILVSETQSEEAEWTNFDSDEETIKDNLTQDILNMLIVDTVKNMDNIMSKKKRYDWTSC